MTLKHGLLSFQILTSLPSLLFVKSRVNPRYSTSSYESIRGFLSFNEHWKYNLHAILITGLILCDIILRTSSFSITIGHMNYSLLIKIITLWKVVTLNLIIFTFSINAHMDRTNLRKDYQSWNLLKEASHTYLFHILVIYEAWTR